MLSSIQNSLIVQAKKKDKDILPINGDSFQEKHFTKHKDKDGVEWDWFWYSDLDNSCHVVRQQINGKEIPCLNSKQL